MSSNVRDSESVSKKNTFHKQNFAHSICCSLDTVMVNQKYSFTFNQREQYFSSDSRFRDFYISQLILLCKYAVGADYTVYIEISRLGRLHIHGTISITDPIDFFMTGIVQLQKMGTFKIDTIDKSDVWDVYCMKQQKYISKLCKDYKLPSKIVINEKSRVSYAECHYCQPKSHVVEANLQQNILKVMGAKKLGVHVDYVSEESDSE